MSGATKRAHVTRFPDESAPSLLIRAAELLSPSPSSVIASLLGRESYAASSVHCTSLAKSFADFLGVTEPEVLRTMISMDEHNRVRLGSFSLEPSQLATGIRRTCPRRFAEDSPDPPYDRLVWCIRILDVDPDTGYPLICSCPNCATKLFWSNTVRLDRCGSCHTKLSDACIKHVADLGPALSLAKLFASNLTTRTQQRAQLPEEVRKWPEADIVSLVDSLSTLLADDSQLGASSRELAITSLFQGQDAIVLLLSQAVEQYRSRDHRWTQTITYARLKLLIQRNATGLAATYLNSLTKFSL